MLVPHGALSNYVEQAAALYVDGAQGGAPLHSALTFDLSVTALFAPLLQGQRVHMAPELPGIDALLSCRNFGPPLRFHDERARPCRLCFTEASAEEIERCRYTPDPDGLEERILADLVERPGTEWQTLIAFVLTDHR